MKSILRKPYSVMIMSGVLMSVLVACGSDAETNETEDDGSTEVTATEDQELVVYSSRNEKFVQNLLDKFESDTGIEVLVSHLDENAVNLLKEEANNTQADIFISNDIGGLEHLRAEGLLQGYTPEGIETIDENYRADDNSWIGLSARTRVLMYNKDLVSEDEVPTSIEELADPQYEGEFAITRGGNGGFISHVSALRNEWGDDKTLEWLSSVKDNAGIIAQGNGDIRRSVGAGEIAFGLVNNYYYHQQLEEPMDNNVGVVYPDQGEDQMGAVINAAGVGFINDAPNEESAQVFLDWILEPENQKVFSFDSMEVPINTDIEAYEHAAPLDSYKVQDMPLSQLGEVWEDTRQLIEESGLDLEIGS
nr:extracellular solute-binding protein [Alkalicoccobacillus porphyridii]